MCYEFERLYWQKRAEQLRQEIEQAEEKKQRAGNASPAKPAAPESNVVLPEPVPA